MKIIQEKKHRLDNELYIGERAIAFTVCIKDKKEYFLNNNIFKYFEEILIDELRNYNCRALVYLFMPNHLHLIISGNESNSNVKKCLEMFKQKTGFYLSNNEEKVKWQKDYFDHIIRDEENLETQIKYILNNPVRAGLVDYWKDYQFKGSTVYNLYEWE